MADATEREREAREALLLGFGCPTPEDDDDHVCGGCIEATNAFRAAVRARVLADVIAVVEGMETFGPVDTFDGTRMDSDNLATWLNRYDLLDRLRAMEGHTDG